MLNPHSFNYNPDLVTGLCNLKQYTVFMTMYMYISFGKFYSVIIVELNTVNKLS